MSEVKTICGNKPAPSMRCEAVGAWRAALRQPGFRGAFQNRLSLSLNLT